MTAPAVVYCLVCGHPHDPADPAVLYRSADGRWWCTDETQCHVRVTMQRALDAFFDQLWSEMGWTK